jgi:hypothetical protein
MRVLRAAALVACLGAIVALTAAPAAASHPHAPRVGSCDAHRPHAVAVTGKVIVYRRASGVDPYSGGSLTTYFACLRPGGTPVAVGQSATGSEYPGNEAISGLHIAGTFVADLSGSGFAGAAACGKYGGSDCQQAITWWVEVADVSARRRIALVQPVAGSRALAVSSTGAVAWVQATTSSSWMLEATTLHHGAAGRLAGTPQTLDTGAIGTTLRFIGSTLSWTNAGQAKSQAVG